MLVPDIAPNGPRLVHRQGRGDRDTRRGDVRLQLERDRRRPARGEVCDRARERRRRDRDRTRRIRRRADRAVAVLVELVVRLRSPGTTPAARRRVDRRDHEVALRRDLRLAEREVDHVHPVCHRCLDRRRDLRPSSRRGRSRASGSSAPCSCRETRRARRRRGRARRPGCCGRRRRSRRRASHGTSRSATGRTAPWRTRSSASSARTPAARSPSASSSTSAPSGTRAGTRTSTDRRRRGGRRCRRR